MRGFRAANDTILILTRALILAGMSSNLNYPSIDIYRERIMSGSGIYYYTIMTIILSTHSLTLNLLYKPTHSTHPHSLSHFQAMTPATDLSNYIPSEK